MRKLLSVIIPIYNVEKYLDKCILSVINQTYTNLEIILVDDGSKDASRLICDKYAKQDNRIIVIHKENAGLSSARNKGLDVAKGEYIAFLDSDDYISEEMYEKLIDVIEFNNCDIAACAVQSVLENGQVINKINYDNSLSLLSMPEVITDLYGQTKVRFEVWNKVFTRQIIGKTRFILGQIYEDVNFDRLVFTRITKYGFLNTPLHFYLTKREGNTNSYFSEKKLNIYNELDKFIETVKELNLSEDIVERFEKIKLNFCMSHILAIKEYKVTKEVKDFLKQKFKELKRKNKNNKYVSKIPVLVFSFSPRLYKKLVKIKAK